MASYRQIHANRENAQRSTGPRTDEGKAQSRRNALKHGLAGAGVVLPESVEEAVEQRLDQCQRSLQPGNPWERQLCEIAAIESIRAQFCRVSMNAQVAESWDEDRRAAAVALAEGLSRDPVGVSHALEQTLAGAEWKLERWDQLAQALEERGVWNLDEQHLAFDLLGISRADRELPEDPESEAEVALDLIVGERARLQDWIDRVLHGRDAREYFGAQIGVPPDDIPALKRLRRYETESVRRMKWALDLMRQARRASKPDSSNATAVATATATAAAATAAAAVAAELSRTGSPPGDRARPEESAPARNEPNGNLKRWEGLERFSGSPRDRTVSERHSDPPHASRLSYA
jgi:hypothetical protein